MKIIRQAFYTNGFLDKTGMTVSWLCAVHCLALPFALASFPLLGLGFLIDDMFEWLLLSGSVLIAILCLLPAYLHVHRKLYVLLTFMSGVGFIASSHLLFEGELIWEIALITAGVVFITLSHFFNRRLCRACQSCSDIAETRAQIG